MGTDETPGIRGTAGATEPANVEETAGAAESAIAPSAPTWEIVAREVSVTAGRQGYNDVTAMLLAQWTGQQAEGEEPDVAATIETAADTCEVDASITKVRSGVWVDEQFALPVEIRGEFPANAETPTLIVTSTSENAEAIPTSRAIPLDGSFVPDPPLPLPDTGASSAASEGADLRIEPTTLAIVEGGDDGYRTLLSKGKYAIKLDGDGIPYVVAVGVEIVNESSRDLHLDDVIFTLITDDWEWLTISGRDAFIDRTLESPEIIPPGYTGRIGLGFNLDRPPRDVRIQAATEVGHWTSAIADADFAPSDDQLRPLLEALAAWHANCTFDGSRVDFVRTGPWGIGFTSPSTAVIDTLTIFVDDENGGGSIEETYFLSKENGRWSVTPTQDDWDCQ